MADSGVDPPALVLGERVDGAAIVAIVVLNDRGPSALPH
jgi:hypothetical protein